MLVFRPLGMYIYIYISILILAYRWGGGGGKTYGKGQSSLGCQVCRAPAPCCLCQSVAQGQVWCAPDPCCPGPVCGARANLSCQGQSGMPLPPVVWVGLWCWCKSGCSWPQMPRPICVAEPRTSILDVKLVTQLACN